MNLNRLQNRAARYCARGEKAAVEVNRKIYEWGGSPDQAAEIKDYLTKHNFLNEKRFAEAYTLDKFRFNKWGKIKIKNHLLAYEIDEMIIEESLALLDPTSYHNVIIKLCKDKIRSLRANEPSTLKVRLMKFLLQKGFEIETITPLVQHQLKSVSESATLK